MYIYVDNSHLINISRDSDSEISYQNALEEGDGGSTGVRFGLASCHCNPLGGFGQRPSQVCLSLNRCHLNFKWKSLIRPTTHPHVSPESKTVAVYALFSEMLETWCRSSRPGSAALWPGLCRAFTPAGPPHTDDTERFWCGSPGLTEINATHAPREQSQVNSSEGPPPLRPQTPQLKSLTDISFMCF